MIGKQIKGRGFRGLLDYLEGKEEAELISGNMVGQNARELAAEFKFSRELNLKVERVVYHASLSLAKSEHLDNKTWNALAKDYLNQMGFNYNQYVVYRHHDRDHDHIHIVASRIKLDGTLVHDSWDYRRSGGIIRQLEKEYGLQAAISRDLGRRSPTTGEQRLTERTGQESIRVKLQNVIDVATSSPTSMIKLIESLRQQGIDAQLIYTREGKVKGITYGLEKTHFSGTQLGRDYTFPGLQKHKGIEYNSVQDRDIQAAIGRVINRSKVISEPPLIKELAPEQIHQQQTKSKAIDIDYDYEL